ncbi:uncharacterized protein LOC135374604 [Ornithodoros turicata]|uniref:uncharacterized protein LOC135374604 n=1 Tax=Ornithodoros turicata TaxID=34597 RepID=UPI00313A38DA
MIASSLGPSFKTYSALSQASGCCGHEEQIKQLQRANDDLKRNIEDLENTMDIQKTVKTLERIVRKMKASQEERPVLEPNRVDLGSGVYVSSATLTRLQESYKDSPSKFARALTRVLFTDEELKNRSLFGKQSNSHKNKDPRPALDENRVTAILGMRFFAVHHTSQQKRTRRILSKVAVRIQKEHRGVQHTCAPFKCADYLVKRSLSAMLQKLNKGTP